MLECSSCDQPILDRFLLKVLDRPWHVQCVQCCECKCSLTEKCFSREGRLYCKNDFFRRFGTKCGGCAQGILPSDLVRRARSKVFHLGCFTCVLCHKQLSTGEELYVLDELKFMCKEDFQQHNNSSSGKDTVLLSVRTPSDPSLSPDPQDPQDPQDDGKDSESGPLSDKEACGTETDEQGAAGKRRGPRTTIKAKQLETLKAAFAAAPKPTRHIREQLSRETGLSMRVIQVWFQNRRSKERRMKQLSTLGGRRHVFYRNPRRMRALGERLEPGELGQFSYYGDYNEYYGSSGNYEYFQGPPPPQAQTPAELGFVPSSVPAGTPLGAMDHQHHQHHHHHPGHQCPGDMQCFSDAHRPVDSPSPEPNRPGSMHSVSSDVCGPGTPYTTASLGDGSYSNQLSQPSSDMSEGTVW